MTIELKYSENYPTIERKMTLGTYYPNLISFILGNLYTGLSRKEAKILSDVLNKNLHPSSKDWRKFSITLDTLKPLELDMNNPADELIYLFLKNHKRKNNYVILFEHSELDMDLLN